MIPPEEESFPRGSRKSTTTIKRPADAADNLFHHEKPSKPKKAKKSNKSKTVEITDKNFEEKLEIDGNLTYNKLQEGLLILGCIKHISNFTLEIEYPGILYGEVKITNISQELMDNISEKLESEDNSDPDTLLKKIFTVGQFVPTKILRIGENHRGVHVEVSIKPSDINGGKRHDFFKTGMLVWGCIKSVLDHGYEISLGVENCRVFLPSKNVDSNITYEKGQPLWMVVNKSDTSSAATNLKVTAKKEAVEKAELEELPNLHQLIPGMKVEFLSEKISATGIQGKFLENFIGYIDETQLKSPMHNLSNYEEGKLMKAYVLYVEPTVNITHLSLRGIENVDITENSYSIGDIIAGDVLSKKGNGIFLRLNKNEKGFVSNKRLVKSVKTSPNDDVSAMIRKKFAIGTRHQCRVLDYNHITRCYVCTVEPNIIKEKIFSENDVKIGQTVTVQIYKVQNDGLVVSAGHIKGFVPNLHISNAQYSDNIKRKFQEGMKVKARVLCINDNGSIIFTLKTSLIESENVLLDIKEAKVGKCYDGFVSMTNNKGALIVLFGNVKGWLPVSEIAQQGIKIDPNGYFFVGQVVTVRLMRKDNEKLQFSFKPGDAGKLVKVGEKVNALIENITDDNIELLVNNELKGILPINHLCNDINLCRSFIKTLKIGDKIKDIICISNTSSPPLFSRREALAVIRGYSIKIFRQLKVGEVVRCFFNYKSDEGIYVNPLIKDRHKKMLLNYENLNANPDDLPQFVKHQAILIQITEINSESKTFSGKIKTYFDIKYTIGYFTEYLKDWQYIKNFGKKNNWNLCKYEPGQKIQCKVQKIAETGGCVVKLPNGVIGLVPQPLCPKSIKEGQSLKGVFLSQNFTDNYAEICLNDRISNKINSKQNLDIEEKSCMLADKLLLKNNFILAVLKSEQGKRQFVYIPLHLHENDFKGTLSYYEKSKLKVNICEKFDSMLIGLAKKIVNTCSQKVVKNKVKKSKLMKADKGKVINEEESGIEILSEEDEENVKINNDDEIKEDNNEMDDEDDKINIILNNDSETDSDDEPDQMELNEDKNEIIVQPKLPGVSSFFQQTENKETVDTSSDEEEEENVLKKRKKLNASERAELLRKEEERISKIEKELADSANVPQSAEQFDRALLANPNSSELWIKYISFYVSSTELEKARAIAKRALEAIDMTLLQEKFNIWNALLRLENTFGTKESFDKVFNDSLKYNDSLQIYLKTIEMLAESSKFVEMEEKIKKCRSKHKHDPNMWIEIAKVYYMIKNFKEARNFKDASLKSIQDKKTQLSLIIRFALLEFKYGEEDQGAAIFETILSSDPRKVNVWTTYVDQLVKKNQIEQARKVLERSICQKLSLKCMKTLFLKFRMFEEQHGTPEAVEAVKEKAKAYLSNVKT